VIKPIKLIQKRFNTRKFIPFLGILFFVNISCSNLNQAKDDILWYKQPAHKWEEALPMGNGRIGVMVFGDPVKEHIQLNDDSMWPADLDWDEPTGNKQDLEVIRKLLFKGQNSKADKLFVEKFSRKGIVRSHQTLGDLFIELNHDNITDYKRKLNISNATATISYKTNGLLVTEKIFVSHPNRAIVIQITSNAKKGLNGKVSLSRPMDEGFPTVKVETKNNNLLIMQGEVTQRSGMFNSKPAPIIKGVKFETQLQIDHFGGIIKRGKDFLELKNVKQATFYLVSNSSYYHKDFHQQNNADLQSLHESDFRTLLARHIKDYRKLYSSVKLKLTDKHLDSIPTDNRLRLIKEGNTDLGMEALLFQFGRYLLISSSRRETNPANLQGLWNQHIKAPWNADYHLNINLQMNYWLADVTGLGELNTPLFDYIDRLIENGKTTAEKNFGCRGSFIPHATDLWASTWLRAPTAYWGCSVGAGGWLMQHYWQHFEFTGDTTFLKERAFPAIKQVTQFYSDWLIEDTRDGTLISAPSTSPENRFIDCEGVPVATCLGSAMDQQIIAEIFTNYITACGLLGIDNKLLEKVKQQKELLRPGFVIGPEGRILEWDRAYKETEPGHRHMSHLYGFHPGVAVSKDKTPEIFEAVQKTINYRLANGGAGTGWSRAWLININARLQDGDMAQKHIQLLIQKSLYINLFDAHPPFQIDGNFGYTAGVAEMLIQSHEDNIVNILPALPSSWKNGFIKGIKARSGLTFDIFWKKNRATKVSIKSKFDTRFKLVYKNSVFPVTIKKGEMLIHTF
jgi:alpha-L-fucosidase 2